MVLWFNNIIIFFCFFSDMDSLYKSEVSEEDESQGQAVFIAKKILNYMKQKQLIKIPSIGYLMENVFTKSKFSYKLVKKIRSSLPQSSFYVGPGLVGGGPSKRRRATLPATFRSFSHASCDLGFFNKAIFFLGKFCFFLFFRPTKQPKLGCWDVRPPRQSRGGGVVRPPPALPGGVADLHQTPRLCRGVGPDGGGGLIILL